jgi:hypothetical protein
MRYMMLMIPAGYEAAAPGTLPEAEAMGPMMRYNEELQKAGILVAAEGLHPPSMGARVSFATGLPVVTDGPFAEVKEVLGGFWIIDVGSLEEAVQWAKRCPGSPNETIEIRRIMEMDDFQMDALPEDVREMAARFEAMQTKKPE